MTKELTNLGMLGWLEAVKAGQNSEQWKPDFESHMPAILCYGWIMSEKDEIKKSFILEAVKLFDQVQGSRPWEALREAAAAFGGLNWEEQPAADWRGVTLEWEKPARKFIRELLAKDEEPPVAAPKGTKEKRK
jgi:hypothetical protein